MNSKTAFKKTSVVIFGIILILVSQGFVIRTNVAEMVNSNEKINVNVSVTTHTNKNLRQTQDKEAHFQGTADSLDNINGLTKRIPIKDKKLVSNLKNTDSDHQINFSLLIQYLKNLYTEEGNNKGFKTGTYGFVSTSATFQGLFIAEALGISQTIFGPNKDSKENLLSSALIRSELIAESGGIKETADAQYASLKATFAALASLKYLNDDPNDNPSFYIDEIKTDALNYLDNSKRFFNTSNNKLALAFFEETLNSTTIAATYFSLNSYRLLGQQLNTTELQAAVNYLLSQWQSNDSLYYNKNDFINEPIIQTLYALESFFLIKSINSSLLNITDIHLAEIYSHLKDYQAKNVIETATALYLLRRINETAIANNISLPNSQFDISTAINFVIDAQFTNDTDDAEQAGGFSPTNTTHNNKGKFKQISLENTFYAIFGLLYYDLFPSYFSLNLETSDARELTYDVPSNFIVQGSLAILYLGFNSSFNTYYDDLTLTGIEVSNWTVVIKTTKEVIGGVNEPARIFYTAEIVNDTQGTYNWSLGEHPLNLSVEISDLIIYPSLSYNFTGKVLVGYDLNTNEEFPETMVPGMKFNVTVMTQNRTLKPDTPQPANITTGYHNILLLSPTGTVTLNQTYKINASDPATRLVNITIPENATLGEWTIQYKHLLINNETLVTVNKTFEISDEILLLNLTSIEPLYPGDSLHQNVNLTLAYKTTGNISTQINATVIFYSNVTNTPLFNGTLVPTEENNFTLSKNTTIPLQPIFGPLYLKIVSYWPKNKGYSTIETLNRSLEEINVTGMPIANLSATNKALTLYYGKTLLFNVTAAVNTSTVLKELNLTAIPVEANLYNITDLQRPFKTRTIVQSLNITLNESLLSIRLLDDWNLRQGTYYLMISVTNRINDSFVPLYAATNANKEPFILKVTLTGNLTFSNVKTIYSDADTSKTPIVLYHNPTIQFLQLTFNIVEKTTNASIENLGVYATINGGKMENETTLPAVAYDTSIKKYSLFIPTAKLEKGTYQVKVYTIQAIEKNHLIGTLLSFQFKFRQKPLIVVPKIDLILTVTVTIIAIGVGYVAYLLSKRRT